MPTYVRTITSIPTAEGVPSDAATITLHWLTNPPESTAPSIITEAGNRITGFLDAISDAGYWGEYMRPQSALTDFYDMAQNRPRVPFGTATHTTVSAPSATGVSLPPEVALVVTYHATLSSGVNPRRARGRLFVGPINVSTGTDVRVVPAALITAVQSAFKTNLLDSTPTWPILQLCVYSRYTHGGLAVGQHPVEGQPFPEIPANLDSSFKPAVAGWVDNAWDTQRRRGQPATTRSTFLKTTS